MGVCRRMGGAVFLGLLAGGAIVFAMDPETREKLWKQVIEKSDVAKHTLKDYEKRLNEALDAGKRAAEMRQKELEGQISLDEEKESPNYIV